jgi:hypothetical protein
MSHTTTSIYELIKLIINIHKISCNYDINEKANFGKDVWRNNKPIITLPKEFSLVKIMNDFVTNISHTDSDTDLAILKKLIEIKTTFNRTSNQIEKHLKYLPISNNSYLQIENRLYFVFKPFGNLIDAFGLEDGHENSFIGDHVTSQEIAKFFTNFDDKSNQYWLFDKILCCLNYSKHPFFNDDSLTKGFLGIIKKVKCFLVNEKRKLEYIVLLIHDEDFYNSLQQEFRLFNDWQTNTVGRRTNIEKDKIWPRLAIKFSSALPLFSPETLNTIKKSALLISNKDQRKFIMTLLDCEHLKSFAVVQ